MRYKIVGMYGEIPFEISEEKIDYCIKNHYCTEHIQLTEYVLDESGNICGLKGLADLGHGYGFNNGRQEFTIKFDETYSFIHKYKSIEGPSDWSSGSFKVTLRLIVVEEI